MRGQRKLSYFDNLLLEADTFCGEGEIAGKTFAGQPQGGGYRHVLFLGMASLIQFIALI